MQTFLCPKFVKVCSEINSNASKNIDEAPMTQSPMVKERIQQSSKAVNLVQSPQAIM